MKFQVGDRVVLNDVWVKHCAQINSIVDTGAFLKKFPLGREALVLGKSRYPECVRVVFKKPQTVYIFNERYLDLKVAATHHTIAWAKGHK